MKSAANRWKTITKKKIYENPWISLEEHDVINPSGNPSIYGKVLFKNLAVAIIPWDPAGHTWLVGQHRYTLDQYSWELPMGGVPWEEDMLKGAQRELLEETGIQANSWKELLRLHTSNSVTDELAVTFIAEDLVMGSPQFDETEDLQIVKLPFQKVLDMALNGEITDGLSLASIFKFARLKGY